MTNTAPILDASGNPALVAIAEDIANGSNLGTRVADLINGLVTDDDGDFGAIAITSLDSQNGSWQYSIDGGNSWTTLTDVSAANAVVLGAIGLYTPGVGGTPEPTDQDWLTFTSFPISSTQRVDDTGVTLNTTTVLSANQNYAGFSNYTTNQTLQNSNFPTLDRTQGFQIAFEAQVIENMFSNVDRTVFNVIVVSSDGTRAIELGFQRTGNNGQGRIFAQSDGVTENPGGQPEVLFTSAEEVSFNTTQFVRYNLQVSGSSYTLRANGAPILTGPLRDYRAFNPPSGFSNPYIVPNFLFLGDNTTSAGGSFKLGRVAVQTETRIRFVPNLNFAGDARFTFRAWDGSDGTAPGGRVNTATNGGQTPVSSASETATVSVISDPSDDITFYTFSAAQYWVAEGNAARTETSVVLIRTGNTAIASSVTVALNPSSPNPATAGSDYTSRSVSLNFAPGETRKVVPIQVLGDRLFEADEQMALSLTGLSANSRLGTRTTATLILRNDDPLNRTGTAGNDTLRGDNTANILNGLGGNDALIGLGGNDTLLGGIGNDQLHGGLGADTQTGGGGRDRFLMGGPTLLAAHGNSLVTAPDRITDFQFGQGDRIQLDYDQRLGTANLPVALFNAGNQTAISLAVAARGAWADKNQTANGRQALGAREAVFFRWRNQTFLAVNDTQAAFAPNRDLLINLTGIQFRAGDATAGVLTVGHYFA